MSEKITGIAEGIAASGIAASGAAIEASENHDTYETYKTSETWEPELEVTTTNLRDEDDTPRNSNIRKNVSQIQSGRSTPIDIPPFKQSLAIHPTDYFSKFQENSWQFCATIGVMQVIFIVLLALFTKYQIDPDEDLIRSYAWFQDVHVMIIVGFGFLMTFLKRYSWSSLGFNFLFAAFTVQWAILVQGFFFDEHPGAHDSNDANHTVVRRSAGPGADIPAEYEPFMEYEDRNFIHIGLMAMVEAEFSTGAILISFGAVLGVASPVQLLVMIILEIVFYKLNAWILLAKLQISDIGGSLVIHAFGAYFGLAVARCLFKKGHIDNPAEGGEYHSDIFSLIGTVFLWMFWPSFNSAPGAGADRYFAVVNTYLALCGACMMTYATSIWATPGRKITMEHVQNATLAGGVAMGTAASMPVQPWGAVLIGAVAGVLSVLGYSFIKPALANAINLHDTCGVHNLHGMPALLAGIAGVITCAGGYHTDVHESGQAQALMQLAAIAITLGISIVGGAITGFFMNVPLWEQLEHEEYFEDGKYWEMDVYQVAVDED